MYVPFAVILPVPIGARLILVLVPPDLIVRAPVLVKVLATKLAPVTMLPTTLAYPATFTPVAVTTICAVELPPMNVDTFAPDAIVIFDVPF